MNEWQCYLTTLKFLCRDGGIIENESKEKQCEQPAEDVRYSGGPCDKTNFLL